MKNIYINSIRYIDGVTPPNEGFSESEITLLEQKAGVPFKSTYRSFLSIAGKRATMLPETFFPNSSENPLQDLLLLQDEFHLKLKNASTPPEGILWCFSKIGNDYYFLNLTDDESILMNLNNYYHPIHNGWDYEYGGITQVGHFSNFINDFTNTKFTSSGKRANDKFSKPVVYLVIYPLIAVGYINYYLGIKPIIYLRRMVLKLIEK
jgi:hypothetical protein